MEKVKRVWAQPMEDVEDSLVGRLERVDPHLQVEKITEPDGGDPYYRVINANDGTPIDDFDTLEELCRFVIECENGVLDLDVEL